MENYLLKFESLVGSIDVARWITAIVLGIALAILAKAITKLIRKIAEVDGLPLPSSTIVVNVVRITIWAIGLSFILSSCFDIDVNGLIAALGVGGIALSLGLQDTIKNFIGGLQVTIMKIIAPGDHIAVGDVEGIVQDISWRQTVVKDYEGNIHLIPNSIINSTEVQKTEPSFMVSTRISFGNDGRDLDELIAEMEALAKQAIEKVAPLEKDPFILLTDISEYGTWGKLRFVLKEPDHAREARDAALRAIAPFARNDSREIINRESNESR